MIEQHYIFFAVARKDRKIIEEVDDDCVIVDKTTLDKINEDKFVQKTFKTTKSNHIVIDLNKQTIKVPELEKVEPENSFFHHGVSDLIIFLYSFIKIYFFSCFPVKKCVWTNG